MREGFRGNLVRVGSSPQLLIAVSSPTLINSGWGRSVFIFFSRVGIIIIIGSSTRIESGGILGHDYGREPDIDNSRPVFEMGGFICLKWATSLIGAPFNPILYGNLSLVTNSRFLMSD